MFTFDNLKDKNTDELHKIIYELQQRKKYGLVWENHSENIEEKYKNKLPILTIDETKKDNFKYDINKINHLLIEADNLEALLSLNLTHKEMVNVIYIDPPYNTGEDGWIYNDKKVDKNDLFRHSKWLSFIGKRLSLAKELMAKNGVIFISIDNNEFAQLKLLCDEIFTDDNFINMICVENNPKGRKNSAFVAQNHEYCLVYAKDKSSFKKNIFEFNSPISSMSDKRTIHTDNFGSYKKAKRQIIGTNENKEITSPKQKHRCFSIYYNQDINDLVIKNEYNEIDNNFYEADRELINNNYKLFRPIHKKTGNPNSVTYTKETVEQMFIDGNLLFCDNSIYEKERDFNQKLNTLIYSDNTGVDLLTETAGKKLKNELGIDFDYPKPVDYIKLLISLYPKNDALILDFFAGSGTTGQAVMDLNAEDNGNRQFILCTNNENGICEKITYNRLLKSNKNQDNIYYLKPNNISERFQINIRSYASELVMLLENSFNKASNNNEYLHLQKLDSDIYLIHNNNDITTLKNIINNGDNKKIFYFYSISESLTEDVINLLSSSEIEIKYLPKKLIENYEIALKEMNNNKNK